MSLGPGQGPSYRLFTVANMTEPVMVDELASRKLEGQKLGYVRGKVVIMDTGQRLDKYITGSCCVLPEGWRDYRGQVLEGFERVSEKGKMGRPRNANPTISWRKDRGRWRVWFLGRDLGSFKERSDAEKFVESMGYSTST